MKEFSKFEIAAIKRTAQNVDKYVSKKTKLVAKRAELDTEIQSLQTMIDGWQEPIKHMTGGFTTEDLITKKIDKSGENPITKYELKYPEAVIPEIPEISEPTAEEVAAPVAEEAPKAEATEEAPKTGFAE